MIPDLPALCIHRIVTLLSRQDLIRRQCDVVRDCACLAVTSMQVRTLFALPLADLLNPPTRYESLPARALVPQLRAMCRVSSLPVGGNKSVLLERLRSALEDLRLPHCHMGARFCDGARIAFLHDSRSVALQRALADRGCVLRSDSAVSSAFIRGGTIQGLPVSLERAVDVAEEMQFLYSQTAYRCILSDLRHFDRERQAHEEEGEAEESRRQSAKRAAVRRWLKKNDVQSLPRSLRDSRSALGTVA